MASVAHENDQHGHMEGAVHAHVSPVLFYIGVFLALLFLTLCTVGQSYIDLGKANIILVIIIASLKAALVVTFFMHLKWDNRFNALMFIGSIFFIGIFFSYTMNDTNRRGEVDPDQNVKVWEKTGAAAPGGFEPGTASTAAVTERHEGGHAPSLPSAAPAAPAHH